MTILSAVAQLAQKNDRNGVRALLVQLEAAMDKVVVVLGPDDAWTLRAQEAVRRVQAI